MHGPSAARQGSIDELPGENGGFLRWEDEVNPLVFGTLRFVHSQDVGGFKGGQGRDGKFSHFSGRITIEPSLQLIGLIGRCEKHPDLTVEQVQVVTVFGYQDRFSVIMPSLTQ